MRLLIDTNIVLWALSEEELPLLGEHAALLGSLPNLHRDPFDRILIAQAASAKMNLLTADEAISRYPGDIIFARR